MIRGASVAPRRICAACRHRLTSVTRPTALIGHTLATASATSSVQSLARTSSRSISRPFSTSSRWRASRADQGVKKRKVDMGEFPPERIRNLSIIAHIDHGKSTLADRLLQMTNTLPPSSNPQFLDKLKVERERGITVKAQTVSIIHTHTDGNRYLINLIDTPGHVDFSYEVSRSLGACEGGLLLVDCTQGIQAQTLSVFHHAVEADLELLAVINKVDLPHAAPVETSEQIVSSLGLSADKHMRISAKSGLGVDEVLNQIIDGLPAPAPWEEKDGKLRGLVFDHFYDHFRGVVALVRVFSGSIKKGDKIRFLQSDRKYEVLEVGIQNPEEVIVDELGVGQVGYVVCNMKHSEDAFIGDTVCHTDALVESLPGFKPMKAMVYAGVFPIDGGEFPKLEEAIERLTLNDRSVTIQRESSAALSQGFRLGFLGTLHMDVFRQRLEDEYDSNVIVTAPTVPYKVLYKTGNEEFVSNPAEFPDVTDPKARVAGVEEPMVNATIFVPNEYIGEMMDLCSRYRGVQQEYRVLDGSDRAILKYTLPLAEIVVDFFSELKSASSGFASFDYEEAGYEASDLVKLNMMLNGKPVDALAMIVHRSAAQSIGRAWTKKLRDVLPRQLFEVAIQAAIGTRVVARETLSAMRKDVTAGLYGGHYERKLKHLNKQKEGKKRLKKLAGNIDIPQSAFFDVLSSRPRAFSTSARRHDTTGSVDHFSSYLPNDLPPPTIDLSYTLRASPLPFASSRLSAKERSEDLSELHRKLSKEKPDGVAIIKLFDELASSASHSHVFTTAELTGIMRSLTKIDKQQQHLLRVSGTKSSKIHAELEALSDKASRGLEVALLQSINQTVNSDSVTALADIDSQMAAMFPRIPSKSDERAMKRYRACVNHILNLCAVAGDTERFDKWKSRISTLGLEEDSYSALSAITLAAKDGDAQAIVDTFEELSRSITEPTEHVILLNYTLWQLATRGHWHRVLPTLHRLAPSCPQINIPDIESGEQLPVLEGSKATAQTFSAIMHALAYQGQFDAAMTIFRTMIEHGFQPHVPEYQSLFKGFARHGVVPPTPAGRLASSFPLFERFNSSPKPQDSTGQSISEIWQQSTSPTTSYESQWTILNLREIFDSFIHLSPSTEYAQAPTADKIWMILLAFARTTNGDEGTLVEVWETLERKFGNDENGWWGWNTDGRLKRLRAKMSEDHEGVD